MSTSVDTDTSNDGNTGGGGRARLAILVVFGLLFGLLAANFLTADDDSGALLPVTPGGVSAEERLIALNADVDRDPTNVRAWQEIATVSIGQAFVTGDPSFYPRAQAAIETAEELAPDDITNDVIRGNLELVLHEFADAGDTARGILEDQPGNIGALTVLVDAQVELGRYEAAADTLQELLDRRPSLPALSRASYLRELNGDLEGAVSAMSQAVTAGTAAADVATVTTLLGDVQLRLGNRTAAQTQYELALELVEGFPPAILGQARLTAANGDLDAAITALVDLTNRLPYPTALSLLAELQAFDGQAEEASNTVEVLRAVTTLQREAGQVVDLELAEVEAEVGDADRAFALAQQTYQARPSIFASSVLAWSLLRVDEPTRAARYARESLELGSLDPVINYRAAEVLADVGEDDEARTAVERALRHDPSGTFRHREALLDLAEQLEVEVPEIWQTPEVAS